MNSSRIAGFYNLNIKQRRETLLGHLETTEPGDWQAILEAGGLSTEEADQLVENVIGIYGLPLGVALNFKVNGKDHLVPMAVEEPSVVAAASNAAKMIRTGGGFDATMDAPVMTAQVELLDVPQPDAARVKLEAARDELLKLAGDAVPRLLGRGGGPKEISVRKIARRQGGFRLVLHIDVDVREAMGANLVNTIAEAIAPRVAEISGARSGLRILTNLATKRCVSVACKVPVQSLAKDPKAGPTVAERIQEASEFAEEDPFRASTHNKGIMNGIDPVVIATGNDWRGIEAGAHAFAALEGSYKPLATWHVEGEHLKGHIKLPMALGTVGGTLQAHGGARLALKLMNVSSAQELAGVIASAGLASNLAAIRALATEGIQKGHMALHNRGVALRKPAVQGG